MSFLSTLFCCFDAEDSHKREASTTLTKSKSHTNSRPRLTKTQSNLQKALIPNGNSSTNNINTINTNTNGKGNGKFSSVNDNAVPMTTGKPASPKAKVPGQILNPPQPTATATNTSNSTKHQTAMNKNSSSEYSQLDDELSDLKDATDSSKDEDDAVQIHEHDTQTQDTDEQANANANANVNANAKPNPNDITAPATFNYEQADYDEQQFGMDLSIILPDQTVASSGRLLDPPAPALKGRKCLVLDLDETLVHSSFKYVRQCDFVIPVEIENQIHNVYVIKRPGVDEFLKRVGQIFEVVVFTASVSRYGDPLLDILDVHKSVHQRLFRDSCYNYQGNYIKNLSQMGRPLQDLIIIDNSPASYVFHPQHAVPISSWFSDSHDCELTDILPFLEDLAVDKVDDIRLVLDINV